MRDRRRAIMVVAVVATLGVVALGFRLASLATPRWLVEFLPLFVLLAVAGTVVVARPKNVSGWALFAVVTVSILENCGYAYGLYPKLSVSGPLPLAWPAVLMALSLQPLKWAFVPAMFLAFPSGRLSGRRAIVAAAALVVPFAAAALVLVTQEGSYGPTELAVRVAARTYGPAAETALRVAWFLFQSFAIGCAAWVLFKLRQGDAVVRHQGKWLLSGAVVVLALELTNAVFLERVNSPIQFWLWNSAVIVFAVCTGVAITKYRLFDIDLLIRKAVLYTLIAGIMRSCTPSSLLPLATA